MPRKNRGAHSRTHKPNQTSALFDLPREIRDLIYAAALTKPGPIDLAPCTYLTPDEKRSRPELMTRLMAFPTQRNSPPNVERIEVVHVQDLEWVRTNLSPNILATCTKIYDEAWPHLWRNNVWRFSNYWKQTLVLRRFLMTIGARARQQLRHIELMLWPNNIFPFETVQNTRTERSRSQHAINHPRLGFVQKDGPDVLWDGRKPRALAWADDPVICEFFKKEIDSPTIRFYLEAPSTLQEHVIRRIWRVNEPGLTFTSLDFDRRLSGMSWLKCVLIAESESTLMGGSLIGLLNELGIDVVLKKGCWVTINDSIRDRLVSSTTTEGQVRETVISRAKTVSDDMLYDIRDLFERPEENSLPARGGRALKKSPHEKPRVLRGFGGCRFENSIDHLYCCLCGAKPTMVDKYKKRKNLPWGRWRPGPEAQRRPCNLDPSTNCLFTPRVTGLVLKKHSRSEKNGVVTSPFRGARQSG